MCEFCHQAECPPRCPNYVRKIYAYCPICNKPVYEDDECYKLPDGSIYHEDCFADEYHYTAGE